jgi:CubicO group peptidase (beta-lactamase class C family)
MNMRLVTILALGACAGSTKVVEVNPVGDRDPDGPNHARIAAYVQPLIDAELVTSVVVGVTEGGRREIYGFGKGPGGAPPNGTTLFELGAVTKVYTGLLLADAVQRREVDLDTPVAELLPTGVTAPVRDQRSITLRHLALHSSGLPPLPPSLPQGDNPFGRYNENQLFQDLVRTQLAAPPGNRILYSEYGTGLLANALGRKIGGGYPAALEARVLGPLALHDTVFAVPADAKPRLAQGTNEDLAPAAAWTYGALAGTGGLISSARDQLALVEAELEAEQGGKGTLRPAMRLTQESQLENRGDNEGLGWQIDTAGHYWHGGTTGGYSAFVGFDPKTRRGVVVLASTKTPLVNSLAAPLYRMLANENVKPPEFPSAAALASYAGTYDFQGAKLAVTAEGKRLYLQGPGEPKMRMLPISATEFWIDPLQSVAVFERDGAKIKRVVFLVGENQLSAPRVDAASPEPTKPAPEPTKPVP